MIAVSRGGISLNFDPDHPLWGFADTHTHPAAHLGIGGKMIVGDPSKPLDQTYATAVCRYYHGGTVTAMGGKSFLSLPIALGDPHFCAGAPDYIGYPRFSVQMKFEHELINRRVTWLLTSQSLLFAAYGVALTPSTVWFLRTVAVTGAAVAIFILVGILAAFSAKYCTGKTSSTLVIRPTILGENKYHLHWVHSRIRTAACVYDCLDDSVLQGRIRSAMILVNAYRFD